MSSTETHDPATAAGGHDEHHPGPREYVRIALILGLLTALEVSTYFVDFGVLGIPMLVVLMVIKFVMVAGFFMHLKFDTKLYSRLLYGGLFLALGLYVAALMIMFFDQPARF